MTTLDLAAIEADLERQLDRTRRMPTEPMIGIRAETLRGLIAAAKATDEPRARPLVTETAAPLRTAILDALMERWRRGPLPKCPISREYIASMLDMILPVAEPMIREAALRGAAGVARVIAEAASGPTERGNLYTGGKFDAADAINFDILALVEPK